MRINKNRNQYDPSHKEILKAYLREHRKLPTLGDDVSDDEESADDSNADEDADSDGGADSE